MGTIMKDLLLSTLKKNNGILFMKPCFVYRGSYRGRNLIAKNSQLEDRDERGFYPVERWIVSKTKAENEISKPNEGISIAILNSKDGTQQQYLLTEIMNVAENELMGNYSSIWPLTKILDIGGNPVLPNFINSKVEEEVPPIPAHVHSGYIKNGKPFGPGKKEAYFFPPLKVGSLGKVITRLGFAPHCTREAFEEGLKNFGINDSLYELLQTYEIHEYDGWTIFPGVVHAPGPWLTFEIQRPQDDFNLCCWQLGQKINDPNHRCTLKDLVQTRGIASEKEFVDLLVKWDLNVSSSESSFQERYFRPSKVLEQGDWGRRIQIFFDGFYGEGFEVNPGHSFTRSSDERPMGGTVWSGKGSINNNALDAEKEDCKEFLIVPNTKVTIQAHDSKLLIYVVFPLEEKIE